MIKEKYKQLLLFFQFGNIKAIIVHSIQVQPPKKTTYKTEGINENRKPLYK